MRLSYKNNKGFSLAEAILATVVLSIAVTGVLLPFVSGATVRAEGVRRTLAVKLANDLLEEIVKTQFDQIIAEYDGYSEAQGQVKDAGDVVFTDLNYAMFSRDVSCDYVYVLQQAGTTAPNLISVTVWVYYDSKPVVTINRLVAE